MKRALIICAVGVIVGAGSFGGFQIYQNHISGDLRRTLTAAADPNCSEADVEAYIRDARLQVRTRKDKKIFDTLVQAVQLARDSSEENELWWQNSKAQMVKSISACVDPLSSECDQYLASYKSERASDDATLKLSQEEAADAKKLFAEFRNDLSLRGAEDSARTDDIEDHAKKLQDHLDQIDIEGREKLNSLRAQKAAGSQ